MLSVIVVSEFFLLLLIKHAIADLALQDLIKNNNKTDYISSGHQHYLHHGLGTLLVSLVYFLDPIIAILIAIIEYFAHWHIDWFKHFFKNKFNVENYTANWWWLTTLDQCLHYSTYYLLALYFV